LEAPLARRGDADFVVANHFDDLLLYVVDRHAGEKSGNSRSRAHAAAVHWAAWPP